MEVYNPIHEHIISVPLNHYSTLGFVASLNWAIMDTKDNVLFVTKHQCFKLFIALFSLFQNYFLISNFINSMCTTNDIIYINHTNTHLSIDIVFEVFID